MAIAPNSQLKSQGSPQTKPSRGTVWVGEATARFKAAQHWLSHGLSDRPTSSPPLAITPSRQAARSLGIPLRSLDQLARQTIHPQTTASVIITHRLLRTAVVKYWETTDPAATVQRILPTIRQYFRAGLDLQQLRDCNDVPVRARKIAQIAIAYQAQLRSRRLIDEAELFTVALANGVAKGDRNPNPPLLFHGYGWPSIDEARFISHAAPVDSVIGLDPAASEAIAIFQQSGWTIVELPATKNPTVKNSTAITPQVPPKTLIKTYAFANGSAEVRWALGQVKQWLLDGVQPQQIALVARDERTYGEWLSDVAWDYETPVRLLFSIPLTATRVGGWVQTLLEAATNNFPFETTAKLLRHPLCGYGITVDPSLIEDTTEDAEDAIGGAIEDENTDPQAPDNEGDGETNPVTGDAWWPLARQRHPEGLAAWRAIGIDLQTWLDPGAQKQSRTAWVSWLDGLIMNAQLRRRAANWARESAAIATLRQQLIALERFQDSPQPDAPLTLRQFADEMRDVLSLATVPAEPGRAGVELHQPRAMVGSQFDHVIVLGAMEGVLPEPIANDPVLDFYGRKQLTRAGFPLDSAATLARREWHHFQSTIAAARRSLTLTYPKLVGQGEQLPSPFLQRMGISEDSIQPGPTNPPANWSEAYRAYLPHSQSPSADFTAAHIKTLNRSHRAWAIEKRRESVGPADEYDGDIGLTTNPRDHVFSASQITALGQCGFKWFMERLLRSRDLPEADSGFSAAKTGTFYHRVLEILLDEWRLQSAEDCQDKLEEAVDQAATEMRLDTILTWHAQRPEVIEILRRAIASDWFMPEGTQFLKGESKFDGEWHDLRVTGQLDRIDRRPISHGEKDTETNKEMGLVIIDYKTGKQFPKGAKNQEGKAKLDVQLDLYKTVAPTDPKLTELPDTETVADAFYFSIKAGDRLDPSKKDRANQDTQLATLAHRVKVTLLEGKYAVNPDRERHACQYCDAKLACRQGDRLTRKITPQPDPPQPDPNDSSDSPTA